MRSHLALEKDMLHGSSFEKVLLKPGLADTPQEGGGTSSARVAVEANTFRACCQNAVAISVMALEEFSNRRKLQVIVQVCKPVMEWHTSQNLEIRSCAGAFKWVLSQVGGGFLAHVEAIV
eukprot:10575200-Alexandrium_andersonii.AAC.1